MVLKKCAWPHELVYMATGQPAMYEDISVPLFVSGYLAFMEMVKPSLKPIMAKHLKELMADAEVCGRAQWSDADAKLDFRRALVWHASQQEA